MASCPEQPGALPLRPHPALQVPGEVKSPSTREAGVQCDAPWSSTPSLGSPAILMAFDPHLGDPPPRKDGRVQAGVCGVYACGTVIACR